MPFYIISIVIQVALVVHIVRTGRNTTWIWIVVMLPLAGSLAYLIVEVMPELTGGRTARNLKRNIGGVLNPNKGIKTAVRDISISDSVENSFKLAEECMNKGMYDEARQLYLKSLKGVHADDPLLMYGLAKAEFHLKNFSETKRILDDLIAKNPNYKNPDAHLLYARTAEELNDVELALEEYAVLDGYYSGPEATYRYANLLRKRGRGDEAIPLLEKIIHMSDISGKHYNSLHKEWIKLARNALRN